MSLPKYINKIHELVGWWMERNALANLPQLVSPVRGMLFLAGPYHSLRAGREYGA